jgi:hypothetical protein
MKDINLHDQHGQAAVAPETRLTLDAAFAPKLLALRPHAEALEELLELAESYARDNDRLRAECARSSASINALESMVAKLDADRASLQAHLKARTPVEDISPAPQSVLLSTAPVRGELRFYKKRFSHRSYDVLIRVPDCRCNRWESGHAGRKAQEGIAKLEGNRADWATIHHCASCRGGGMWRVRW